MFEVRELNVAIELWGMMLCVLGIEGSLLFVGETSRQRGKLATLFATEFLAMGGDAVAAFYRGRVSQIALLGTRLGNFTTFTCNILLLAIFTSYLCSRFEDSGGTDERAWRIGVWVVTGGMVLLTALGAFYHIDSQNIYHRTSVYPLTGVYAYAIIAGDIYLIFKNRTHLSPSSFMSLLIYCLMPLVAMSAQIIVYGLNFLAIAETLGSIMLFLETQIIAARTLVEQNEELAKTRIEVTESRIQVMVSQIQPHFIFNTLDSIYYLCGEDPERAQEAVDRFSTYLRANIDSLSRTTPVPIDTELAHVRTYLELEELSLEDLLTWSIEAEATGFLVPALSLQTLAENAVKHGLGGKPEGGSVTVRTSETPEAWIVTIEDDGVGFDAAEPSEGMGVGIENTRMRLDSMCSGTLDIESTPGQGTTCTVTIPKTVSLEEELQQE